MVLDKSNEIVAIPGLLELIAITGYSAENFNIIRKIALGLISNQTDFNSTKKLKMKRAALDDSYREKILNL